MRAAVLSTDGRLLGHARRPLRIASEAPGRAEHDPRAWLEGAVAAGAEAVATSGGARVEALAVGALGPAPVLVDERLRPLTPALLFSLDTRAEPERAELDVTLTQDHALPKLVWWARHEPAVRNRAAWALDAAGFLASSLTGVPTMDTITAADYRLDGADPPFAVPQPVDPLAVVGGLAPGPARALGLPEGTPVAAGTYDTYVDVAGIGVRRPGDACLLLGSTLVVCRAVAERIDCDGLELAPYPGDGLLLGGWTATAGAALAWGRRELGAEAAAAAAALEPGAGGLLALPFLAGERTPIRDPFARGLVLGLTLRTTRAQLYRALVDAVALSARDNVERLVAAGLAPSEWLVGGGGTRDAAWLRATVDALGTPLAVVSHAGEAAAPAVLALRAIGLDAVIGTERTVEPNGRLHERFERLYASYRSLHPLLAETMRSLQTFEEEAG